VACNGDGAPSCPNPERPFCLTSGALAGSCSECTASNTSLCNVFEPACLIDLGICGCATDQSCGAVDSGLICTGPGGLCQPGCGTAPRNGCPSGQTCSPTSNGGQCTMTSPCSSDNDCAAPLAHCDAGTGRCVGCLVDNDCPAPLVCDGTSHTCLECTPADSQNCGADLSGAQCLAGGRCGCTQDGDCGGTTSGRICDPASSRCVPGCRGTGGNGCPSGEICTSVTADVGSCNGHAMPDGGAAGADGGAVDAGGRDGSGGGADGAVVDAGGQLDAGAAGTGGSAGMNGGQGGSGGGQGGSIGSTGGQGGAGGRGGTGGPSADGAPPIGDASGVDAIGAVNPGGYIAGGGCDCSTPAGPAPLTLLGWTVVAALGWTRRRRRR